MKVVGVVNFPTKLGVKIIARIKAKAIFICVGKKGGAKMGKRKNKKRRRKKISKKRRKLFSKKIKKSFGILFNNAGYI